VLYIFRAFGLGPPGKFSLGVTFLGWTPFWFWRGFFLDFGPLSFFGGIILGSPGSFKIRLLGKYLAPFKPPVFFPGFPLSPCASGVAYRGSRVPFERKKSEPFMREYKEGVGYCWGAPYKQF